MLNETMGSKSAMPAWLGTVVVLAVLGYILRRVYPNNRRVWPVVASLSVWFLGHYILLSQREMVMSQYKAKHTDAPANLYDIYETPVRLYEKVANLYLLPSIVALGGLAVWGGDRKRNKEGQPVAGDYRLEDKAKSQR